MFRGWTGIWVAENYLLRRCCRGKRTVARIALLKGGPWAGFVNHGLLSEAHRRGFIFMNLLKMCNNNKSGARQASLGRGFAC